MQYPALDVSNADSGLVLAVADDYSLAAAEEHTSSITLFFIDSTARARAHTALARAFPGAHFSPRDVDDGDWARRSQGTLQPVAIGRLTITPPWAAATHHGDGHPLEVIIEPSMGFGTGHHATTRLCLAAMQALDLAGTTVVDVGTGSGVLALAARLLGAQRVIAIDRDADAVRNANDNLALNSHIDNVVFECVDLTDAATRWAGEPIADLVLANLTGALLTRNADKLVGFLRPLGRLVVSGLLTGERTNVTNAFRDRGNRRVLWESEEDGWTGLVLAPVHVR